MSNNNSLKTQGGGIKKKNGHKETCLCPICKNIKHAKGGAGYEVKSVTKTLKGGKRKSNGHKANCGCPICKNMKKSSKSVTLKGGKKKSNGHKANCGCPICKNMKKQNRGGKVDDDESSDETNSQMEEETSSEQDENSVSETDKNTASSSDVNSVSDEESTNDQSVSDYSAKTTKKNMLGGKKQTKKNRKSNGHKKNCKCPICKNMKRSQKTH